MSVTFFSPMQNTLSLAGPDAFSAGGQTLSVNNGAAFSTSNPRTGTHGGVYLADFDSHNLSPTSIFNAAEGAFACSIYVTNWVAGELACGFIDLEEPGDLISLRTLGSSGSGNLRLQIGNNLSGVTDIDTSGLNLAVNTMLDIVCRWHAANGDGRIEVRNTAGTLLGSAQNLAIPTGHFPSTSIDFMWLGRLNTTAEFYGDNWMVGNTYNEPLENYHAFTSYSQIGIKPWHTQFGPRGMQRTLANM